MSSEIIDYAKAMKLPAGKTCADCILVKFCTGIGCTKPENTNCDYYPNRFSSALALADGEQVR